MAALAGHSVSFHARPLLGRAEMPERPRGSFTSSRSLTNEANFSGDEQQWHVIGSNGVTVRETDHPDSPVVTSLPFACLLTVTDKLGGKVKISSPVVGWAPWLTPWAMCSWPGGADAGVRWRYRVVCRDGAFVRHGIELTSAFLFNLPWHSVVEVLERRINEAGLPRLKIAEGWISEVLNPLSGQRGPVVQILRLLRPLSYRVTLQDGAVVRRTVELASAQVRTVPCGEVIEVCAKQFSDLGNRCVQRLKLADGSGWLSMRLNKDPPEDVAVVEFVGVALAAPTSMSPLSSYNRAGGGTPVGETGGWGAVQSATEGVPAVQEDDQSIDLRRIKGEPLGEDDSCVVCLSGPRTATIVHGEIGHIACCLECARILKARGDNCPVCRIPIDSVVQHFWA